MKKTVAVIAGGDAGEFEVSMGSAAMVYREIDRKYYEPYLLVMKANAWFVHEGGKRLAIDRRDFSFRLAGKKIVFDLAFIAIHGTPGEDGKLQGYLDMLKIPYTAGNTLVSALTFNKFVTKQLVTSWGFPMAKGILLKVGDSFNVDRICRELKLPLFVKPNCNGSSVGVTKVKKKDELVAAIEEAFRHDTEVVVETYMPGREIACGVYRHKGELVALPLCEIVSKKEFFDYEAKYTPGMADEIVPAPLSAKEAKDCVNKSLQLYQMLGCKGIVRFDYILSEGVFNFLEVNTVPGLGEASIVPKMARHAGLTIKAFYTGILNETLRQEN